MTSIKDNKGIYAVILVLTIIAGTGAQFIMDMVQGVATPMYQIFGITTKQFNMIYTFFSSISLFFAPVGGYITLRYGVGNAAVLYSALICFGTFIANYGAYSEQWINFEIGWAIIGFGFESMINTQVCVIEKYFSGDYLSFCIGLKFACSLLIGSFSDYTCPELYLKYRSLQVPFFAAAIASFIGFFASATLNLVDFKYDYIVKEKESGNKQLENDNQEGQVEEEKEYEFQLKDVLKLKPVYWMTIGVYCLQFNLFAQLLHTVTDLSVIRFNYSYKEAKNFIAIYKIGALITLPIASFIVGKYGKKSLLLAISALICLVSFITIYLLPAHVSHLYFLCIMMVSVSYAIYTACIWPSMSVALPKSAVSLGYGIAASAQKVAGGTFPIFVGKLSEGRTVESYERVILFLCLISVACICLDLFLVLVDLRNGKALWLSDANEEAKKFRIRMDREFRGLDVGEKCAEVGGLLTTDSEGKSE